MFSADKSTVSHKNKLIKKPDLCLQLQFFFIGKKKWIASKFNFVWSNRITAVCILRSPNQIGSRFYVIFFFPFFLSICHHAKTSCTTHSYSPTFTIKWEWNDICTYIRNSECCMISNGSTDSTLLFLFARSVTVCSLFPPFFFFAFSWCVAPLLLHVVSSAGAITFYDFFFLILFYCVPL